MNLIDMAVGLAAALLITAIIAFVVWSIVLLGSKTKGQNPLKAVLVSQYIGLAVVVVGTWNSGIAADEQGIGFSDVAIFGIWWPLTLAALLVAIIGVQVTLCRRSLAAK